MTVPPRFSTAPDDGHPRPPRGLIPGPLGRLLASAYGREITRRNRRFDAAGASWRAPVPVISVGNLSVGGTGKTPMVSHLCSLLLQAEHHPAIAMRGYSRARGRADADEPDLFRRTLPSVPVLVGPKRGEVIRAHLAEVPRPQTDCVVLDDGFQHRKLSRDLDLVLVDATRSPFDDHLLPLGWLREPVGSLRRASHVIITHAGQVSASRLEHLEVLIRGSHGKPPIAATRHVWTALKRGDESLPLDWLLGRRVVAACAVGNPGPFLADVRTHVGADLPTESQFVLRDHDPFSAPRVAELARRASRAGAEAVIVTEKDWSKLRHAPPDALPCPIVRPTLSLSFLYGAPELERAVIHAVSP